MFAPFSGELVLTYCQPVVIWKDENCRWSHIVDFAARTHKQLITCYGKVHLPEMYGPYAEEKSRVFQCIVGFFSRYFGFWWIDLPLMRSRSEPWCLEQFGLRGTNFILIKFSGIQIVSLMRLLVSWWSIRDYEQHTVRFFNLLLWFSCYTTVLDISSSCLYLFFFGLGTHGHTCT